MNVKNIYDYPRYKVSSCGKIFNISGQEMKGWKENDGYKRVKMYRKIDGKTERGNKLVHRIVAENFIPNPKNCELVNHKNGKKYDNRVENLEWCTNQENIQHAWDNNLVTKSQRKVARISDDGAIKKYNSIKSAAEKNNLKLYNISRACRMGRKHGGYRWIFRDIKYHRSDEFFPLKIK